MSWDQLSALLNSNQRLGPWFPRAAHAFTKKNTARFLLTKREYCIETEA